MKNFSSDATPGFPSNNRMTFFLLCLSLALIFGLIVRIPYFLIYDFALNDGGLFVEMSEAIKSNAYILPKTVSYNQLEIPFAYPPFSFYLVAFLSNFFGFKILDIIRYLPLVFNILSICTFILLMSQLIKNKLIFLYAALFFPLIPRSYEWLIMGGGVTRSVGFFFALIAIYLVNCILSKYDIKVFVCCSLFLAMTALSHLEWGITGIMTVTLLILSKQFNRRGLVLMVGLGAMVLIITSPWWFTVMTRHGLAPFLAASKTSDWQPITFVSILASIWKIIDDKIIMPLSLLAIMGGIVSLARKDWFLPVWLVAIFLTTPRHGATAAAMPLAILAAIGLAQFLMPVLIQVAGSNRNKLNAARVAWSKLTRNNFSERLSAKHVVISCIVAVTYILLMTKLDYIKHTPLVALTAGERSAMTWLKDNTPPEAEFIVLSESFSWQDDRVAEWFPVLSDRKSLTTAQGLEWMPGYVFRSQVRSIEELKQQQASGDRGLAKYIESHDHSGDYVAAFIPHADASYGGFVESGHYRAVYDRDSVVVFERIAIARS